MERTKPQRLYSEEEVGFIIERAAKSQRQTKDLGGRSLSLSDLEQIAADSGLSAEHIRQAVAELDARPRGFSRILGAPTRIHFETELPGEITPDQFDVFVAEVQRGLDEPAQVSAVGRLLTITAGGSQDATRVHITLSAAGGKTVIRVDRSLRPIAGGLFGGLGGGLGGGMMAPVVAGTYSATNSAALAVAAGVTWLSTVVLSARTLYRSVYGSRSREVQATHESLVALARQMLSQPPEPSTPGGL